MTKKKELEIIASLEDKPIIKKKRTPPKVIPKPEPEPVKIEPAVFEDIEYTSNITYKLNQIGIRRKLQKLGKYKKDILNIEVIEIKILKSLWDKYCNWFNNKFNIVKPHTPEIFESDK
jgi:hypothetical protein